MFERFTNRAKRVKTLINQEVQHLNIANGLKEIIVDSVGVDKEELTEDALLIKDIGVESLDLLDIGFRIEKKFHLKTVAENIQEMITTGKITINGIIHPINDITVGDIINYTKRKIENN